ncbi:MAG: S9 family peptidase [Candidatus Bathyarchaeia archaeon]
MKKLKDYKIIPIFPVLPVSDPQISPNGGRMLFTYTTINMEENKYDSHIWLLPLKERKPKQFTYGKGNDINSRWSPDGSAILFLSNRVSEGKKTGEEKRKMQIWVIPANGGEARCLTSVEGGIQSPAWSSDGKTILFFSNVFKGERAKGSDVKIIRRIRYRFDGLGFFPGERTHLFSVPSRGGRVKQLTDEEFDVDTAVWSPDSRRIAFVSNLEEDADFSFFKNIYIIPSRGGKPELLWDGASAGIGVDASEGLCPMALGWSPDGRYLAFTGRVIEDPNLVYYKNTDIWVLPVEGGEPKNLTAELDRTVLVDGVVGEVLKWSPDSRYVYFKIPDQGSEHLCRVSLDGKVEKVTEGKITVGSFTLNKTGSIIALSVTDAMTPSELWIKDEKGMRRVTEMNKGLLKKLRLSEPEEFWFTASDGIKIQGWIVKPHDFKEGEQYPMIIGIHGGPHWYYGYRLMEPDFQVLADHGFVVVYTNPRGSTGFGESFATEIAGNWGKRDYQDIMEAVDYVIRTYPFIDPERLGVMGVSYGGFMTNWIVGHTDRFKAAVSLNSECNYWSCYGTSDVGWLYPEVWQGKAPWDDLQMVMEQSPITYIKNMKTPLLLIHSEEDYRCPIEQSEQLFIGLKTLKRVVEFVRFPGESHGFGSYGKPKHRVERLQHIVRWFYRYLRGSIEF